MWPELERRRHHRRGFAPGAEAQPASGLEPSSRGPYLVPGGVRAAIAGMVSLLDGEPCDLRSLELDESGLDDFRRGVYAATRGGRPGTTATYRGG